MAQGDPPQRRPGRKMGTKRPPMDTHFDRPEEFRSRSKPALEPLAGTAREDSGNWRVALLRFYAATRQVGHERPGQDIRRGMAKKNSFGERTKQVAGHTTEKETSAGHTMQMQSVDTSAEPRFARAFGWHRAGHAILRNTARCFRSYRASIHENPDGAGQSPKRNE